jgi:hypothetical protein
VAKHSKYEKQQRKAESERVAEITAAWFGSLPKAEADAFTRAVDAARSRPPPGPPPNMAPGTRPNPPRVPPRPTKGERNRGPRD